MIGRRQATALGGLLAFLGAAAGCTAALGSRANADGPAFRSRPNNAIGVVYSRSILVPERATGEPYQPGQPELDVRGRRIFVGSSDQGLYALRAQDGAHLWRFETLGFVQSRPLYDPAENVLYFGSNDGALYRVDANTGELHWRFMTNAAVSRRPVLSHGLLYFTNANDTLLALDPESGKLVWQQHRTPAMGMEIAGYAGPTVYRDKVYTGFSDGTVLAFDARTGTERWQPVDLSAEAEQVLGELPAYLDVDTTPVPDEIAAGSVVYVANYAGGVFALDSETGTQVWQNSGVLGVSDLYLWSEPAAPAEPGQPAPEPRKILIASSGTTGLWGLDPDTGRELWRRAVPYGGVSEPAPILGALLVSATQLGVFLVWPLGGALIDGIHIGGGVTMSPAAYCNRALAVTNAGRLLALHIPSPRPLLPEADPAL